MGHTVDGKVNTGTIVGNGHGKEEDHPMRAGRRGGRRRRFDLFEKSLNFLVQIMGHFEESTSRLLSESCDEDGTRECEIGEYRNGQG